MHMHVCACALAYVRVCISVCAARVHIPSMFILFFALVSMNLTPILSANSLPSSALTTLYIRMSCLTPKRISRLVLQAHTLTTHTWSSRSILLPKSIALIVSVSFTVLTSSIILSASENDDLDIIWCTMKENIVLCLLSTPVPTPYISQAFILSLHSPLHLKDTEYTIINACPFLMSNWYSMNNSFTYPRLSHHHNLWSSLKYSGYTNHA